MHPFSFGCSPPRGGNENTSPSYLLTGGVYRNRNSKSISASGDLLREFTAFLHHPEQFLGSDVTIQSCRSSPTITTAASLQWDASDVVRDAVRSLTEIRPPSDFAIYPGGNVIRNNNTTTTAAAAAPVISESDDNMNLENLSVNRQSPSGPPIFDGAVANATPNFGTTGSGGGGLGTALHAVAALDHPLTMSLLLVMGADTRACHTAFRRLVQHEAACNGSIQCLSLLLELGNRYGEDLFTRSESSSSSETLVSEKSSSTGSPDSILDFPFFSRRTSNAAPRNLSALHSKPMKLWKKVDENTQMPADILLLLRLFHSLVRQVEAGSITELDAARAMVQQATLCDEVKVALAIQCGYNVEGDQIAVNNVTFNRRSPSSISSDGHGNTPLHWAAFKNESACISLLLKYRADPNARAYPSGWTPLHDAAYSNGRNAIALLIDAGAVVDARASSGATPLCFAAQEDAAEAAELLLIRGADLGTRCSDDSVTSSSGSESTSIERPHLPQTRFSGYTPLHYCAHYNASKAAKVLLQHHTAMAAMEIRDLNGRLPIHVAVARGSSNVLRELLVAGARVETRALHRHHSSASASPTRRLHRRSHRQNDENDPDNTRSNETAFSAPSTPLRSNVEGETLSTTDRPSTPPRNQPPRGVSNNVTVATPVSSPLLRAMIPSQPVQSSKPWNCLSQRSIDECRQLISEVEQNWTPDRHSLFTPADRRAVAELLRVGKRLEAEGSLSFTYLWPEVLSFCGRGWFEVDEDDTEATDIECVDELKGNNDLALPTFC
jgi:ankyrin repeat protein